MPITTGQDTASTRRTLDVQGKSISYYSIDAATEAGLGDFSRLPAALKVVLENMLRFEDGKTVTTDDIKAFSDWGKKGGRNPNEIAYRPARVLMQDFTGVPAVVDLAAMRDGIRGLGGDVQKINPLNPVDLVIDHSVMIDEFGNPRAFQMNVDREYERNMERYQFLKWGQGAFENFRVVPPGTGICHQVNLEYLSKAVWSDKDQNGEMVAYPDTLVGTDSHTTMVNGLAVLGWGVGGIEAEAAMLGQPISMLIPEVVGFKLTGKMVEGTTGTDLVLKVVEMLREKGVVGKFVEFYGEGLDSLPLADRATIANMAPEYGATCGFFPIDGETLRYLRNSGRDEETIELVEAYAKENGFWRDSGYEPIYTDTLALDMGTIVPAISGPKRPQDYIALDKAAAAFGQYIKGLREGKDASLKEEVRWEGEGGAPEPREIPGDEGNHKRGWYKTDDGAYQLHDGSIVIASITSCTNTSNPYVMIGAGLVARKARELGLTRKPWVKTSLAPGSQVVSAYLEAAGLQEDLDAIGFNLVGYGCTTCNGMSGPLLSPEIEEEIRTRKLETVAATSGNRNFEGRVHPLAREVFIMSPPLIVAYAIAGTYLIDPEKDVGFAGRSVLRVDHRRPHHPTRAVHRRVGWGLEHEQEAPLGIEAVDAAGDRVHQQRSLGLLVAAAVVDGARDDAGQPVEAAPVRREQADQAVGQQRGAHAHRRRTPAAAVDQYVAEVACQVGGERPEQGRAGREQAVPVHAVGALAIAVVETPGAHQVQGAALVDALDIGFPVDRFEHQPGTFLVVAAAGAAQRQAARLEGPGRQPALVLHEDPCRAVRLFQDGHRQDRRHDLAKRDAVLAMAHGQQLAVAPERRLAAGEQVFGERRLHAVEVVAHEAVAAVGECPAVERQREIFFKATTEMFKEGSRSASHLKDALGKMPSPIINGQGGHYSPFSFFAPRCFLICGKS